jgi:hypothetical protein
MWRLFLAFPCWIIYQIFIFIPLMLLGWVMVPIATACGAYKKVQDKDGAGNPRDEYHFTWRVMFIWDNVEDGIYNDTYWKAPNTFLQIVYWSCLRNPVNNLRVSPTLSCQIDAPKVRFVGSITNKTWYGKAYPATPNIDWEQRTRTYDTKIPQWFFAWQTIWHSNFYWQFNALGKLWRFWLGNAKIYPTDIYGGPYGYRERGAGPVAQFKRVKT